MKFIVDGDFYVLKLLYFKGDEWKSMFGEVTEIGEKIEKGKQCGDRMDQYDRV